MPGTTPGQVSRMTIVVSDQQKLKMKHGSIGT
jgi:hypothetical protein